MSKQVLMRVAFMEYGDPWLGVDFRGTGGERALVDLKNKKQKGVEHTSVNVTCCDVTGRRGIPCRHLVWRSKNQFGGAFCGVVQAHNNNEHLGRVGQAVCLIMTCFAASLDGRCARERHGVLLLQVAFVFHDRQHTISWWATTPVIPLPLEATTVAGNHCCVPQEAMLDLL